MNADHAKFAESDAAFVLGALSPSDRRRFEAHLQDCDLCRDAIVELAPTIALMARVAPDRAESLLDPALGDEGPDAGRRGDLIAIGVGRSKRRRRLWWAGGVAAAAAVIVAVVLGVTLSIAPAVRGVEIVALEPLTDVPVTATVQLEDVAWGTRLQMICRYADTGSDQSWPYALYVIGADGTESAVSSWTAFSGSTARLGAGTALRSDDIAAIEIRSVTSGKVLMRSELEDGDLG